MRDLALSLKERPGLEHEISDSSGLSGFSFSAMDNTDKKKFYFQTIARHFFEQRGAPFYLSSKELDLISSWEKKGIPLRVVLEGIKKTFENCQMKRGRKQKVFSLLYCNLPVLKIFNQHKERKIGLRSLILGNGEKDAIIKAEVEKFLKNISEHVNYLAGFYSSILSQLSQGTIREEQLEQIEEQIEELIVKNAPDEVKEKTKREVQAEFQISNKEEFHRVFRIKLIQKIRDKYKVPHISPFYY